MDLPPPLNSSQDSAQDSSLKAPRGRKEREATALRANLMRRKEQLRARKTSLTPLSSPVHHS